MRLPVPELDGTGHKATAGFETLGVVFSDALLPSVPATAADIPPLNSAARLSAISPKRAVPSPLMHLSVGIRRCHWAKARPRIGAISHNAAIDAGR